MAISEPDYPTQPMPTESDSPTNTFLSRNRCFNFPYFRRSQSAIQLGSPSPSSSSSLWDRLQAADTNNRWWARPIRAIKKLREWSEIMAGPKWKTFIRRFSNRHNRHHHYHNHQNNTTSSPTGGKFQYDPLSYALNFDEGQNGQFDDEMGRFNDFSSRYVVSSTKKSIDLGRGGVVGAG